MKTKEKINILKDQLLRFRLTKQACDACIPQELIDSHEEIIKDLEILEILKNHLYVAKALVELKIVDQQYADSHKVKYHNGIPIVDVKAIDRIYDWYYERI